MSTVVIDPGSLPFGYSADEALRLLPDWLRTAADAADARDTKHYGTPHGHGEIVRAVADQIEAQTKPPKPAEPTGLGAVVEDARGEWWVQFSSKTGNWWRSHQGVNARWADLDAARVLSEGVTA